MGRGALIVLEGCDRAGKSTQAKMLMDALTRLGFSTKCRQFPNEVRENREDDGGAKLNRNANNDGAVAPAAAGPESRAGDEVGEIGGDNGGVNSNPRAELNRDANNDGAVAAAVAGPPSRAGVSRSRKKNLRKKRRRRMKILAGDAPPPRPYGHKRRRKKAKSTQDEGREIGGDEGGARAELNQNLNNDGAVAPAAAGPESRDEVREIGGDDGGVNNTPRAELNQDANNDGAVAAAVAGPQSRAGVSRSRKKNLRKKRRRRMKILAGDAPPPRPYGHKRRRKRAKSTQDRQISTDMMINADLTCNKDLPSETVHLLFSANRWEYSGEIKTALEAGTTVILDRYAASGAAYGAANTGRHLDWCKEPDKGLPAPDIVAYLRVDEESQKLRSGCAGERFERKEFQQTVACNYLNLADDTWKIFEKGDIDTTHSKILAEVMDVLENVADQPIKKLYDS